MSGLHLWTAPPGIFCSLPQLSSLNLSSNYLQVEIQTRDEKRKEKRDEKGKKTKKKIKKGSKNEKIKNTG